MEESVVVASEECVVAAHDESVGAASRGKCSSSL
jgi:hypothetical protein